MPAPRLWLTATICFLISGCGSNRDLAKVVGTITFDGKPLSGATVTFQPVSGQRVGMGKTNSDGRYALSTYGVDDGTVVGDHRVTVVNREAGSGGMPKPGTKPPKPLIAERYFDVATSGLTAKVENRRKNVIDFELASQQN
jgi:hypothetical protein